MTALVRTGCVAVVAVVWATAARTDAPKPLSEVDVLKLVELKIPDDVIARRVQEGGVAFPAGDETIDRLKKAGASDAVLAAVRKAAKPAPAEVLSVWVKRNYGSWDNPLHSELSINGTPVGTFSSDTDKPVAGHVRPGWNTITLKTAPQADATQDNDLIFRIGPVATRDGKRVMTRVLWEFRNGTDWKHADGKYAHKLGPAVKDVTLTYRVYFAGLEPEARPVAEGDYVLTGRPNYSSWNGPLTGTVSVNGHAVSTFLGEGRQLVITPYLKKGENVVKLTSVRVKDAVADNDLKFSVGGPASYNVTAGRYELKPVAQFEAMQGWKRDAKTGQLVCQAKPDADTVEREVRFTLDDEPGKK